MHAKLTLRLQDEAVKKAKSEARRRGKSVSAMVEEFFDALEKAAPEIRSLPPITRSLVGVLKNRSVSEEDYRRHLREKHL